ncbi:hypothetical protein EB796_003648 [Bugula neritina]|uniref:Uncharacterized protein n=1 Tax=Bugula neritina TaxID=10212 RepID=A0A7J7KKY1_BUGNE|nr:hypothetical protein EB796_003648 [Bugula neritina]
MQQNIGTSTLWTTFLFQLGRKSCSDMVKRAMRRVGTNGLWSLFSMKSKAHKQHKKLSLKKLQFISAYSVSSN